MKPHNLYFPISYLSMKKLFADAQKQINLYCETIDWYYWESGTILSDV